MWVTTAAVIAATTRRPLPGPPSSNRCANRWCARAIRRDALSAADQLSLDLFVHNLRDTLRFEPFAGYRSLSMGALGGFESDFAELLSGSPVGRSPQVEQTRVRMAAYPRRADQELARLREGMAPGWVPRTLLGRVLVQIDAQLAPAVEQGSFYLPFTKLGAEIPAAERSRSRPAARRP